MNAADLALRRQLDRRPLIVFGAGLVVGLTAIPHPVNLLVLVAALVALLRPSMRFVLAVGFLAGLVLTPTEPAPLRDPVFVDGVGTVVSIPRASPEGASFNLATDGRTWRVSAAEGRSVGLGDLVRVTGPGMPLREGSESYFLSHGVSGRLEATRLIVVAPGPWPWRAAQAWRGDFSRFCQFNMSPVAASLTEALCFDLNAGVDPAVSEHFKRMGALHLLVASGLHVLLLAGLLLGVLSFLPVPRAVQIGVVGVVLLLYAGATGLTPAVVRASLMFMVGTSAYLVRRDRDALSALGLAAVAYLLWQPREVYDAGLQLSFVTVAGIALFFHPDRREERLAVRVVREVVGVSWIAFLASAPLIAFYFGILSTVSLPANLLVGLAASVCIGSAFVAHALSWISMPVGVGLATVVTAPLAGWILEVSERVGGQSWASISVPAFSPYWLVLVYGAALLTWRQRVVLPE